MHFVEQIILVTLENRREWIPGGEIENL